MSNRPLVPAHIERLSPYVPGKPLAELARQYGVTDAVKLASNESPLGPSPKAVEAGQRALAESHRYPDGYALRAALARHHQVDVDEVVLGDGSNELIDLICRTFAAPGSHAVYPDPSFVCYRSSTIACDMNATVVPLAGGLEYDVDALIAGVRPDTRLLFVANPNNPTGAYLNSTAVRRLLGAVPPQTLVVLDEAYVEFADAADFEDGLMLRDLHANLIVLRTFSKAYGLAGMRVGYGILRAELAGYIDRVRPPFNVNSVGLAMAEAALEDRAHLAAYVELNRSERVRVAANLVALGLGVAPSLANFLVVDVQRPGRDVYEALLPMGVIVRPMPPPLGRSVRISLGLPAENDRMVAALASLVR